MLKSVGGMGLLYYPGEKFGNAVIRVVYKALTMAIATPACSFAFPSSPRSRGCR